MQVLHTYGAYLNGMRSLFHLPPLTDAFVRGYFNVYKILLERGARPILGLDRNFFRSFGTDIFKSSTKGRRHFIQLLFDHGKNIQFIDSHSNDSLQEVILKGNLNYMLFVLKQMESVIENHF